METAEAFESWAIVEVMGHGKYAGYVTEQSIGGTSFVRVDVPQVLNVDNSVAQKPFTKLLGSSSIFAITPCDSEIAHRAAAEFRKRPIDLWELHDIDSAPKALSAPDEDECPI